MRGEETRYGRNWISARGNETNGAFDEGMKYRRGVLLTRLSRYGTRFASFQFVKPNCMSSCTSHFCVAMSSFKHAVKLGSRS